MPELPDVECFRRVAFVTDSGELRYRDMRELHGIWLPRDASDVASITGGLGPDAVGASVGELEGRLGERRTAPSCGRSLRREAVAGRSTVWCPSCQ